jgi:hypothetical protein
MSQITLTNTERRSGLERLGYNEREAEFLCLAALHGGYFVRRQYAQFLRLQDGGTVSQLIEKTLELGHAHADTYRANMHIYHLSARPFYAVLGQEDNRNRRRKEPLTIKAKLMGLDFVLAHPHHQYLTTEREKVGFFEATFGIKTKVLPIKRYAGSGQVTERYFVEKFPIAYSPNSEPAAQPLVSFCFIDPGLATVDGFETFLDRYAPLLAALPHFRVIYVAATDVLFGKAQGLFDRFITGDRKLGNGPDSEVRSQNMLAYFEARRLYETKQLALFDRTKLLQLRDLRQAFSGPEIEALYARWKATGANRIPNDSTPKTSKTITGCGQFSTYLLDHSYDLFGSLTAN